VIYRGFPERLHHRVPSSVEPGALFHIRIGLDRDKAQKPLIDVTLAQTILDSAKFYEAKARWHITLFLLMRDHLHAVLSFAPDTSMSDIIRDWNVFISELTASCGRKAILIIGCGLTNAACSFQQNLIIFAKIRWQLVSVRERGTGLGL
jgi:hypothetical protein